MIGEFVVTIALWRRGGYSGGGSVLTVLLGKKNDFARTKRVKR